MLFTDIVASTARAEALGDAAWGEVLRRHRVMVRAALRRYAGNEMDTAGDGFFATFSRPTDALACGAAIVREAAALDLHVRVGVHVGEVDLQDGKAGGIALHVAARLMGAAQPDEVLVSATVRELAAGSGFTFADQGVLTLKGLAEPVHAYGLALESATSASTALARPNVATRRANLPLAGVGGALAIAALLVGTYLVAGGHGPGAAATSPSGTAGASPSEAAGAPSLTMSPWTAEGPENGFVGIDAGGDREIAPGRYVIFGFRRPLSLTLGAGWSRPQYALTYGLLQRSDSPNSQIHVDWLKVLPDDPCAQGTTPLPADAPEARYASWLQHTPALQVSPFVTRYFGSLNITQTDVSVVAANACPFTDPPSVLLGNHGEGWTADIHYRIDFTTLDGLLLRLEIAAPAGPEFQAFDPVAESVLTTAEVGPEASPGQ